MTEYEKGYKDGMAGAALPNIIDNGDKIDGYAYSYKTDSDGVPYINIDCVRAMLTKAADHRQLAEWLTELKEAKRLLKAAVEDIHELLCDKKDLDGNGQSCNVCSYIEWCPCCKECTIREDLRNWRYADEALKLIGGSENGT